jgi:hypothetical protein
MPARRKKQKQPKSPPQLRLPAVPSPLLLLINGYKVSQLVHVAAELGLADVLAKGPLRAEALAERVGADPTALRRVLRALASFGVFAEDAKGRWKLTPLAQSLRSDHPQSMRDFARMMIDDYNWDAWGGLLQGVRDGKPAFDRVHGMPFFDYLQRHPEKERVFAASMASISGSQNPGIAASYPFGELTTLVDVGGAHGHLLAAILRRHKKLKGVLYDQPQVVAGAAARGFIGAPGVRGRIEVIGGDFFESVPAGADGYLMKYILHDWNDERCARILGLCRDAMAPKGRVLAVESAITPRNRPDVGKLMDINMFVLLRGKERTREEFAALFASAGLKLRRVVPTGPPGVSVSVIEGVRA